MMQAWRLHHFGLAAADPRRAAAFVESLGYTCGAPVHDPLQRVELRWCLHPGAPAIEIVSTAGDGGPLQRLLAAQPTSFYHLCYELPGDTAAALDDLRRGGLRALTVREPVPAVLFGGRRVSFHQVQGFGLVELLERVAP